MRELKKIIHGTGEVKGFTFRQVALTKSGYIYEVTHPEVKNPHYEVFRRRVNHRFQLISYPRANAFGVWAWTYPTLEMARQKLEEISQAINDTSL
jgi:hypothetical protein